VTAPATIPASADADGAPVDLTVPPVRVRPAPPLDPPYETERQPPAGMQLLPLEWPGQRGWDPPPGSRAASTTTAAEPPLPPAALPKPTTTRPRLPSTARAAAQRFVGVCVEVLNGFRPAAQLRPLTDVHRFKDVADQLVRRTSRMRLSPGQAAHQGKLLRVRRMMLCEPCDGVAEAAVVLEQGQACWAMAVRLECGPEGWRCTVVQVV
jgi:Family of unknown function (DUF6459)